MSLANIWSTIWKGKAEPPTVTRIAAKHVVAADLGKNIRPRAGYFQLTVNQLFLEHSRQWLTKIDPMVMCLSEFIYAGERAVVPFVVGPGSLKAGGVREPAGMIYSDTQVAGLHPYVGGPVSFALVLCQVPIDNIANRLLGVVEATARVFSFSTAAASYVKVGGAVLTGIDSLLGLNTTLPLVGWKQTFNHDDQNPLSPGYFALIAAGDVPPEELWVKERKLFRGPNERDARPFRDSDFVLFSLTQPPDGTRSDTDKLPFAQLWERVVSEASVTGEEGLKSLQANFTALSQAILLSPDLIPSQADALIDDYFKRISAIRAKRSEQVIRGGNPFDDARSKSLQAFNLK